MELTEALDNLIDSAQRYRDALHMASTSSLINFDDLVLHAEQQTGKAVIDYIFERRHTKGTTA